MQDLERRVSRLEDRAAIHDLVVAYFLAADGDDMLQVRASFTADATFSASGQLCAQGRQGIVDFISKARTQMGLTVHTPHYAQVTFDSDRRAKGIVGAHLELVIAGSAVYGAVRYVDVYERAESWKIRSRDMRTIFIAPWLQLGEVFASTNPVCWPGGNPSKSDYPRN
jgi:hypothetical protein